MNQFNLSFTEQEVNTILLGLATLPYKDSATIINSIYKQANEQKTGPQAVEENTQINESVDNSKSFTKKK